MDETDKSPGFKFAEQEMRGIPVRIECGPKDIEANQAVIVRRDTREKTVVSLMLWQRRQRKFWKSCRVICWSVPEHTVMHTHMWQLIMKSSNRLSTRNRGFIKAMWCGCQECEDKIKEDVQATSRCIPFEQENLSDKCVCCGKPAKKMVYWGRAY